jgi:amino-acid N-acetyltransferase
MNVEKARINDVTQIQKLVNHFADRGEMLHRPLSELYENIRDYFVARDGDEVIACAALHVNWLDLAEIKAVAVAEDTQAQGAGRLLVEACLEEAGGLGIPTVFCLTYRPDFFERFGFRQVDVMELPRKVWGECQRCPKFPNCDEVALILQLK